MKLSVNCFGIKGMGYGKAPDEISVTALNPVESLGIAFLLEFPLTRNGEGLVLYPNVDVLQFDFGQVGLEHQLVVGLVNIHRRGPRAVRGRLAEQARKGIFEQSKIRERVEMAERHGCKLLVRSFVLCGISSLAPHNPIIKYEHIHVKYF